MEFVVWAMSGVVAVVVVVSCEEDGLSVLLGSVKIADIYKYINKHINIVSIVCSVQMPSFIIPSPLYTVSLCGNLPKPPILTQPILTQPILTQPILAPIFLC